MVYRRKKNRKKRIENTCPRLGREFFRSTKPKTTTEKLNTKKTYLCPYEI